MKGASEITKMAGDRSPDLFLIISRKATPSTAFPSRATSSDQSGTLQPGQWHRPLRAHRGDRCLFPRYGGGTGRILRQTTQVVAPLQGTVSHLRSHRGVHTKQRSSIRKQKPFRTSRELWIPPSCCPQWHWRKELTFFSSSSNLHHPFLFTAPIPSLHHWDWKRWNLAGNCSWHLGWGREAESTQCLKYLHRELYWIVYEPVVVLCHRAEISSTTTFCLVCYLIFSNYVSKFLFVC